MEEKDEDAGLSTSRANRKRKRRLIGLIVFYIILAALLPALYFTALYFTQETRLEGQVVPPSGMMLFNEVWIVTDFRTMATGVANDLADNRQIILQDMQEKNGACATGPGGCGDERGSHPLDQGSDAGPTTTRRCPS